MTAHEGRVPPDLEALVARAAHAIAADAGRAGVARGELAALVVGAGVPLDAARWAALAGDAAVLPLPGGERYAVAPLDVVARFAGGLDPRLAARLAEPAGPSALWVVVLDGGAGLAVPLGWATSRPGTRGQA